MDNSRESNSLEPGLLARAGFRRRGRTGMGILRMTLVLCAMAISAAVLGLSAQAVSAAKSDVGSAPIFQDCAPGEPCFVCLPVPCADETYDFSGPYGFGVVEYTQDSQTGALTFSVHLKHAVRETTYTVSFACGGESHGEFACPSFFAGTLTTNKGGKGKSADFVIDAQVLAALPEDAAHVDIASNGSGVYVAPNIRFQT
jgi:hypothetical protein